MERGGRFEKGKLALRRVTSMLANAGYSMFVGLWWGGGLIPFCIGLSECVDAVEEYAIAGGRGCWDHALREALKLALGSSIAVLIGCCRSACDKLYRSLRGGMRSAFLCVAGFSEKTVRVLREYGFELVTEDVDTLLGWLGGLLG